MPCEAHGRYDVFEFQVFSGWDVATGFVGAVYVKVASKLDGISIKIPRYDGGRRFEKRVSQR
jgi:hypothetical protein